MRLIQIIIILLPVAFYLWMFWHMANNPDLPGSPTVQFRWPPVTKLEWMTAFIILNILTAGYYYLTVYRERD